MPTPTKERESLSELLKGLLDDAVTWQDAELSENRTEAYGYYKAELPAEAEAFTSTAVSTDVADTVEWILPSILKPLIESPDVVRFDPTAPRTRTRPTPSRTTSTTP